MRTTRRGRRAAALISGLGLTLITALPLAPQVLATSIRAQSADSTPVAIQLFAYGPASMSVAAGATVMWINHDGIVHSVTSGTPDAPGDAFDSGLFDQDQTFSQTFVDAGEYPYFCTRHPFMQGVISVV